MKRRILSTLLVLTLVCGLLTGTALASSKLGKKYVGNVPQFSDISENDWFYNDVLQAAGMGLINGYDDGTFRPSGYLTYAEAVKLAACLASQEIYGHVSFESGSPWYMPYVSFAIGCGIETFSVGFDAQQANSYISRERFVAVLYNALSGGYDPINTVADGAIPDYSVFLDYAPEIYDFYRAGILTGSNGGYFYPDEYITRSEVAAILIRMTDSSVRKSVTLTEPVGQGIQFGENQKLAVCYIGWADPSDEYWYFDLACEGYTWESANADLCDLGGDEIYFVQANTACGMMDITDADGNYVSVNFPAAFVRCSSTDPEKTAVVSVGEGQAALSYPLSLDFSTGLPTMRDGVLVVEYVPVYDNFAGGWSDPSSYYDPINGAQYGSAYFQEYGEYDICKGITICWVNGYAQVSIPGSDGPMYLDLDPYGTYTYWEYSGYDGSILLLEVSKDEFIDYLSYRGPIDGWAAIDTDTWSVHAILSTTAPY